MKVFKSFLYILIPLACLAAVGMYFGHLQYIEGLKREMDESDNFQWAVMAGFLYSPLGLIIGLIFDLLVWLITNEPETQNVS